MPLYSILLLASLGISEAAPVLSVSVPASGDESFPTNGDLWLMGRNMKHWPQEVVLPKGFPRQGTKAPWEKNPDVRDLWREPRRKRWREDNRKAQLKMLVGPGEGIALVEAATGKGVLLTTTLFPVAYRPPLTPGEAQEGAKARASKNVLDLIVVHPEEPLKPSTDYALIANGELVAFNTATGPDTTPPEWEGLSDIRHEGQHNSVFEVNPAIDNSPFPVRVEIYRGEIKNVKLRQFALVEKNFQIGRLSPFNESCVFAKVVDVAGNATEMLPCFAFPPLPEKESAETGICSSTKAKPSLSLVLSFLLLLVGRRSGAHSKPSS